MPLPPRPRLRFLLFALLLAIGVDLGVALAQEVQAEGKTGSGWVRCSGGRAQPSPLLLDLPDGAVALPSSVVDLPPLGGWVRLSTDTERRLPRAGRLPSRTAYPRGPPA